MRRVYFAFQYKKDVFRVNQVRRSGLLFNAQSVGFADRSVWEEAKKKGDGALEELILDGLDGTSATVVMLGEETAERRWVKFEISRSRDRNNALLGVRIHHLLDHLGKPSLRGPIPKLLAEVAAPIYDWQGNPRALNQCVEAAVDRQCGR